MASFRSALLKIQRAGNQADELLSEARTLFNTSDPAHPSYRIEVDRDVEEPRKWRAVFRQVIQPPEDWGILLGEVVHNLRSALDHLVYEASALDGSGSRLKGTEFPIYLDESRFLQEAPWKIRGLNDATKRIVERIQPFANIDPEIIHGLWMLHQLSNTDKHRLLNLVTVGHVLGSSMMFEMSGDGSPLMTPGAPFETEIVTDPRLEDGVEFFTLITLEPLPPQAQVHVSPHIEVQIRFGDATATVQGLEVFDSLRIMGSLVGWLRAKFVELNA